MKRISKILLRLGRGGASNDDPSASSHSGGSSTGSDFRQLTSKRWRGGAVNGDAAAADVFRKRVLKTGTGLILADGSPGANQPCEKCQKADFVKILNWQPGDMRPWVSLAHTVRPVPAHRPKSKHEVDDEDENEDEGEGDDGEVDVDVENEQPGDGDGGAQVNRRGGPARGRARKRTRVQAPTYPRARIPAPVPLTLDLEGTFTISELDGIVEGHDPALPPLPPLPPEVAPEAVPEAASDAASEPEAQCPWCKFFQAMISTEVDWEEGVSGRKNGSVRSKFTPYLRIRLAFERLGCTEKHLLSKSILFEVTTRNRSLPWGYIVKAVPATADNDNDNDNDNNDNDNDGQEEDTVAPHAPVATIRGRKVPPFLDPALVASWMSFCKDHHRFEACSRVTRTAVPGLKLIDCEAKKIVLAEELSRDSSILSGAFVEYATLSYVRGSLDDADDDHRSAAADADDVADHADDAKSLVELPQLFADAISVSQSLGIRHLWIDRYCVPSKRDAADDPRLAAIRKGQIEMMGRVYSQSELTLVVAAGSGVQVGIPGISAPREEQLCIKTETDFYSTTLLRPDLEVASSPWASRAWTYQEGLLSRRRLVFTPWQTYFQCHGLHCLESVLFPLQLSQGLNFGRVFPAPAEALQVSRLGNHIKAFMAKSLADDEDRLDAFRGILYEYAQSEHLGVEHLLGLPLFHHSAFSSNRVVSQTDKLAVALGWMASPAVPTPQDDCDKQTTIDPYYLLDTPPCPFPSWTWLSWRLQAGRESYESPDFNFNFNLMGDAMPLIENVAAAPWMEISVGFADGVLLSWEIDGEAIARKTERIEFLRLKTFSFGLTVGKSTNGRSTLALELAEPAASILGQAAADTIETWVRRCSVTVLPASADEEAPPERETYPLTGLLLSGRNWKFPEKPPGPPGASPSTATVLICGRRNWEPEGPLVRLGVLSIAFDAFELVPSGDPGYAAQLRRVDAGASKKGDLPVQLLELDIY